MPKRGCYEDQMRKLKQSNEVEVRTIHAFAVVNKTWKYGFVPARKSPDSTSKSIFSKLLVGQIHLCNSFYVSPYFMWCPLNALLGTSLPPRISKCNYT